MNIATILTAERVARGDASPSKKRALETLSALLCKHSPGLAPGEVLDSLLARERLGSTGLGHGVAIPHGRLKHHTQCVGAFLHLNAAIEYDAADGEPVDLLFGLMVPEDSTDEHLQILAKLAEMFSDESFCAKLRASGDAAEIFDLLTQ